MKKIGFLHTSPVHVATFDRLFQAQLEQETIELIHLVDEPLLANAMTKGVTAEIEAKIEAYVLQLAANGCEQIVCSCSTIGGAAESISLSNLSILRVDRPMAAAAVKNSHTILMVAAIDSTLAPTRELLLDESGRQGRSVQIEELVVADAWAEFLACDLDHYHEKIAEGVRAYLADENRYHAKLQPEIIVFAQASMAPAVQLLPEIDVPILTSPELCTQFLISSEV